MNRRGVALTSAAHVVDDFYQGCIPALLPFLAAERHYTYAAISGLTLAATVLSSVAQPFFGWWTDRVSRRWLISVGILLAATGVGLVGQVDSYRVTWVVIAVSGLGVAAFHPEAARAARQAAGDSNRGMSLFALGGNAGFALGTLVATPILLAFGLRGTALLAIPAVAIAVLLVARLARVLDGTVGAPRHHTMPTGEDDWRAFWWLTAVVVARSILFFALTSFLALYFIRELGTTTSVGGAALTTFLVGGAAGTLLGGWVADRSGQILSVRIGLALIVPGLAAFLLVQNVTAAFVLAAFIGVGAYMPFSVFMMLGQNYLPQRIGTASGVTIGLGVSVGGLFTPLFGRLADLTDLRTALWTLLVIPVIALLLSTRLRPPARTVRTSEGGIGLDGFTPTATQP